MSYMWCLPCLLLGAPSISINGSLYTIERLLGEGGFLYVYLVQKRASRNVFAIKKIRCPYGSSDASFGNAMREIRNYHRFDSPNIVKAIDEAAVAERDGLRLFYILLPYFKELLQDVINAHVLNSTKMPERDAVALFKGICKGVEAMHKFTQLSQEDENDPMLGDELAEMTPYAHRDLKPANVMLNGTTPVLVDLGLCSKARVEVRSRQQALQLTEFALEHCTLPYRAPELLDVPLHADITELTDIWSLGCVFYSCLFGYLPFEKLELEQGANLNVAIAQAKYEIPESDYSSEVVDIIRRCLVLDPLKRPTIDELMQQLNGLQS